MIVSTEGSEATAKSTLMFTAPLPIVAFCPDLGYERAIYGAKYDEFFAGLDIKVVKYPKIPAFVVGKPQPEINYESYSGHDITIYELPSPMQLDPRVSVGYMEQWAYFLKIYVDVIQDASVATVGIDTMTVLTKSKREAYLQELQAKTSEGGTPRKQLQQIEYGHPDGAIRNLYEYAKAMDKNLITVHHLRETYGPVMKDNGQVGTGPTGAWELEGIRDSPKLVDIQVRNEKSKSGKLTSKMLKCGYNLSLENLELDVMTWDNLVDLISMSWHGSAFPRRKSIPESAK